MHIRGMTIGGIPPFTEPVDFEFDERVNVFIGPNGTGKTTLLKRLTSLPFLPTTHKEWSEREILEVQYWDDGSEQVCIGHESRGNTSARYPIPEVFIPAGRREATTRVARIYTYPIIGAGDIKEHYDADEWQYFLSQLAKLMLDDAYTGQHDLFRSSYWTALECSNDICDDLLLGNKERLQVFDTSDTPLARLADLDNDVVEHVTTFLGVNTSHGTLFVGDISSGMQTIFLFLSFLAYQIAMKYQDLEWGNKPAILCIDEIENHLHPTWQRRVIPALLKHFPGLQIFATTHSPFVVAGLKAGQVHLLNRDENGVVTATTNTDHIEGWTADEILRVYMGVDEPTDEVTAQAAQALRRLRNEGPSDDEGDEDARQSEMSRLRQIVDRSELSGPRAAEDARFLADLRSILDRYSGSQDLNQENA